MCSSVQNFTDARDQHRCFSAVLVSMHRSIVHGYCQQFPSLLPHSTHGESLLKSQLLVSAMAPLCISESQIHQLFLSTRADFVKRPCRLDNGLFGFSLWVSNGRCTCKVRNAHLGSSSCSHLSLNPRGPDSYFRIRRKSIHNNFLHFHIFKQSTW